MKQENESKLVERISRLVYEAIQQVCGGGITEEEQLRDVVVASISFPNKKNTSDTGGKPHDIEVRVAMPLFHRWKRSSGNNSVVTIFSDFGVRREVASPKHLAELLCLPLEEGVRVDGISHDVRCQPSGVICIVTHERSELLRQAGKLPCPRCCQWCKGKKGLWWHQQQKHSVEYSEATAVASSSVNEMAIVPYVPKETFVGENLETLKGGQSGKKIDDSKCDSDEPIDLIRNGNLSGLKQAVCNGYDPSTSIDQRGASPLMWAAGSGNLEIVQYLIEKSRCDPNQPQKGKRSFCGRTSLHWSARNGHLPVVKYLVDSCSVDLEAATIDGTTAFCWACWQGHLQIMEGCNIHATNSFGCNAVLWCAQGKGEINALQWLGTNECNLTLVNNNGHGVLHKAAQRGWKLGCEWFFDNVMTSLSVETSIKLVGPDTEGYCPSDLAGMEGNEELARFLANAEMKIALGFESISQQNKNLLPEWLTSDLRMSTRISEKDQYIWEQHGGIRRMRSKILIS